MLEYVRLVDAGLIRVDALSWNYWGLAVLVGLFVWLLWGAVVARGKVGFGQQYTRGRRW